MKPSKIVIGIYYHPEAYPPTLNAVGELSRYFKTITVVFRPNLIGNWQYPPNVIQCPSGRFILAENQEKASTIRKVVFFLRFVVDLITKAISQKPAIILLYDQHALFAYYLIRPFLFFRHKVWYHNHDIAEITRLKKYSIGWFASKAEQRNFDKVDIFTLPAAERLAFFPVSKLKGKYFIVPNYPSIAFYTQFYKRKKLRHEIKLIFQGRIGEGHGLEEILPLLTESINGKHLSLTLKGHCSKHYRNKILLIAKTLKVDSKVVFAGYTPYAEVPKVAAECHIGIGIFAEKEIMHITLGTASNKLYEYAALGLPILYNDEQHFEKHLGKYNWAFPVKVNTVYIKEAIGKIDSNYDLYSQSAENDFHRLLNFEYCFKVVLQYLSVERLIPLPVA